MKRIKFLLVMLLAMLATQTTWAQETKVATSTFTEFADVDETEMSSEGIILTEEGNNWAFYGAGNPEWPRCTTENGKFAIKLYGKSITLNSNFNLKGTVKKITIRAGGNLGSLVSYIWCSSDGPSDFELGSVDVSSSDVKDYVFTADESAGSRSFVNDEEKKHIYVLIKPRSGSDAMILESITVEYVEEQMEDGTSGKTGVLDWKIKKLDGTLLVYNDPRNPVEKPKYRLTISGNGDMPDYEKGSNSKPWNSFETITEVVIEEGVKSIGMYAFNESRYLSKATLPSSLKMIGFSAFDGSSIIDINFPEGLETIINYAFSACFNLKNVTLPASLNKISPTTFNGNKLNTLTVASGNGTYDSRDNCNAVILTAENLLVLGTPATVIPATVTSIGESAFTNGRFKSFVIPDNVSSIGKSAFYYSELTELYIGRGVTNIGENAFKGTTKLADVNCYANPATLTWTGFDAATNFMADKATKIHVKKADLSTWQANFGGVNATFVGDLDGGEDEVVGDANGDGEIDVADIDFVIEHIGEPIDDTNRASDVNGDGEINVADVDYIIERIK